MKGRHFLSVVAVGFGLIVVLLWSLTSSPPLVRADPTIYYVRLGGQSTTCHTPTNPCGTIRQAIALATSPGDEVWVATGTYVEHLSITYGVKLRGGWDISFNIQAPAIHPTIVDGNREHVIQVNASGATVQLEDLTLTNGRDGIHVDAGIVTATRCIVQNYTHQGIEIDDGTVWLMDNLIRNGEREGIEIDAGTVTVSSNTVDSVGRHGILVQGGTVLIENNVVHAVTENPDMEYHGIEISGTHVVRGNQVSEIDHYGIYAHHGASTIVNNVVHNTGSDGIHTDITSTDVEIRGNTAYNTGRDGIDTRGQTIVLASNVARTVGKDGIHVDDASTAHIQQNTIYDAYDDCIDAGGDTAFITGNLTNGCGESGIKAEMVSHTSINANQVYNANQDNKLNKAGINLDDAGTFTVTNNVVAESSWASVLVETAAGPHNFLYHNTIVGSATGQQGIGIAVNITTPVTIVLANNIVVSHSVGISATAETTLVVSNTLLWGNGAGTLVLSGTLTLFGPPLFVAPAQQNYHLLPNSPAIDAGTDVGVTDDVDGNPRPNGAFPDIGADEFWLFEIYLPLVQRNYQSGTLRW